MDKSPHSPQAEASVVGQMLADEETVAEIIALGLKRQHFHLPALKLLFGELETAFYGADPTDALSIAEPASKRLSKLWACSEPEAVRKVEQLAAGQKARGGKAGDHAKVVRRDAAYRALLDLSAGVLRRVDEEDGDPEQIAGEASELAMRIATETTMSNEILSFDELGGRFEKHMRTLMSARKQGIELGAYFGMSFVDSYTRGLQPSELMIIAGEPGVGKSAVTWKAAQNFAERQRGKPKDRQIGCLVLSLEMAEEPSNIRIAQANSQMEAGRMREGRLDQNDLKKLVGDWKARSGIPLYFNFTSTLRASQLRALVIDGIRRGHNIGVVVIDHLRYFDMDGHFRDQNEAEEAKSRFLKQDIATQLNCAVICLAHTTKGIEATDDRRPQLSHLRGSGQIAAHADFVGFVYRPYNHAKREDIEEGRVKRTDAEMIWRKNRHGLDGIAGFHFDPTVMSIY